MKLAVSLTLAFFLLAGPAAAEQVGPAAEERPEGPILLVLGEGVSGFDLHLQSLEEVAALVDPTPGMAVGIATLSQVLVGNRLEEEGIHHSTSIEDSFNDGVGLFSVNQDAGNFNNQANVRAVVATQGGPLVQALSISVESEQRENTVNSVDCSYEDRIAGSFNRTHGVVGVNQASGSGNNQANVMVLAMGAALSSDVTIINDIDLENVHGEHDLPDDPGPPPTDSIVDSFHDFVGVAQVTQATGNLNSVHNVLGISVTSMAAQP